MPPGWGGEDDVDIRKLRCVSIAEGESVEKMSPLHGQDGRRPLPCFPKRYAEGLAECAVVLDTTPQDIRILSVLRPTILGGR